MFCIEKLLHLLQTQPCSNTTLAMRLAPEIVRTANMWGCQTWHAPKLYNTVPIASR